MRMNDFVRRVDLERAYDEHFKMKAKVYRKHHSKNHYEVKLEHKDKTVILTEIMKDGLPEHVYMDYNGERKVFKRMYEAGIEANKILRE
jgi:hypothetical protein